MQISCLLLFAVWRQQNNIADFNFKNTPFPIYATFAFSNVIHKYSLTVADVKSLDFTVIRFLMKQCLKHLIWTSLMTVYCTLNFHHLVNLFRKERRNLLVVTICFGDSELTFSYDCFLCILLYTVLPFVWRIKIFNRKQRFQVGPRGPNFSSAPGPM